MTAEELEKLMEEANRAFEDPQPDYRKALKLYKRAVKKKNGLAACRLGMMYAAGKGTLSFYSKAIDNFRDAIDWGETDACNKLALMYDAGRGVGQNSAKCADLYRDGMDGGSIESINNLGYMYEHGRGMPAPGLIICIVEGFQYPVISIVPSSTSSLHKTFLKYKC